MKYEFEEIIKKISLKNKNIDAYNFVVYPSNEMIQKRRENNEEEKNQIGRALDFRNKSGFSFWESLMSTFIDNPTASFELLSEALYHNENKSHIEFLSTEFSEIEKYLQSNSYLNIAFLSKVKIGSSTMHLPLIDFHIPPSNTNQETVENVLMQLGLNNGFLINSGKSYHFISTDLVFQQQFELLLAQMIFFTPIIDRNWIAHQLIEKCSAVRICKGTKTNLSIIKEISLT